MNTKNNEVFVAGFAQFPKGTPVFETHKVISCVLVIDKDTDIVIEASFSFLMDVTKEFVSSLVRGKSVKNGVSEIIKEIEGKFIIPGQRAVIQSLVAAYDRYSELK